MLKLKHVHLFIVKMPFKGDFSTAHSKMTDRHILLARLEDQSGAVAWSECVAQEEAGYLSETVAMCWDVLPRFIGEVLNRSFDHPSQLSGYLESISLSNHVAKAVLEMGFWGVFAELKNRSLASVLGGEKPKIGVGIVLGFQPTYSELVTQVRAAVDQGYRRIKFKIDPNFQLEWLSKIREDVGLGVEMAVDANASFSDPAQLKSLEKLGLAFVEQPFDRTELQHHQEFQNQTGISVCLDESIGSLKDVQSVTSWRPVITLKPGKIGGLSSALTIHEWCRSHQLDLWCGGMLETGIGRAYNVALASLPGFNQVADLSPSDRYWAEDIVDPVWTMSGVGEITVPYDQSGLGVTVRESSIRKQTVQDQVF